jgi:hypothetical protein
MRGDGWRDGWSLGTLIDGLVALALTFAIARYGLGALFGMLPWLLVRDRARPWPWGAFAIAALALGLAIAIGLADLGELSHALWAAAIQALVWVHASGRAQWFWGGLTLVGLVCAVAPLLGAVAATPLDVAAAAESWWQQWHWWALATLGCGAVWLVLRFRSKEPTTQDSWPESHPTGAALQTTGVAQRLAVGRDGEARVRTLFLAELPTGTWVLNNLLVPGLMGDIDLLVVGANGVFLPEIKTWAGTITCAPDGRSWSRLKAGRQELLPDPAAQTQRAIHALRTYLERADPGLCRRTQLWIHGLIVFAHPRSSVDGAYSPVPALSPEDAVTAIVQAVPPRPLSLAEQERIVDLMAAVQPTNELYEYTRGVRNVGGSRWVATQS